MKDFFQNNQLLIYSTVAISAIACVVVGVFLALEEKGTVTIEYYEDGTVERKMYYRGDESLEKIEFHQENGMLFQTSYYQTSEDTLERIETFRNNGTTHFIDYIDNNGATTKLEEYRQDGTLYSVTYVEDGLNTTHYYDAKGKNVVSTPVQ